MVMEISNMTNLGHFNTEALVLFRSRFNPPLEIGEETGSFDFTTCQRPDGSFYGTSGKCRKGKETTREQKKSPPKDPRMSNTDEMVERVKGDLPKGAKVSNQDGTIAVTAKTASGHEVKYTLDRTGYVDFEVNGGFNVGTVIERKEQIEVAYKVKEIHEAMLKNIKPGYTMWTTPYEEDGRVDARVKAYKSMGFSDPDEDLTMMGVKGKNGKISPGTGPNFTWDEQDFSSPEKAKIEEVKMWYQAIFGKELNIKGQ